jgi:hypothetical protein
VVIVGEVDHLNKAFTWPQVVGRTGVVHRSGEHATNAPCQLLPALMHADSAKVWQSPDGLQHAPVNDAQGSGAHEMFPIQVPSAAVQATCSTMAQLTEGRQQAPSVPWHGFGAQEAVAPWKVPPFVLQINSLVTMQIPCEVQQTARAVQGFGVQTDPGPYHVPVHAASVAIVQLATMQHAPVSSAAATDGRMQKPRRAIKRTQRKGAVPRKGADMSAPWFAGKSREGRKDKSSRRVQWKAIRHNCLLRMVT